MTIKANHINVLGSICGVALLLWPAAAPAQNVETIVCRGTVTGGNYSDVIVTGGSCTLNNATVFGSILVEKAKLTTNGVTIFGSIQVKSGRNVTLNDTDVSGEVKLEDSRNLAVESGSTLSGVSMKNSRKVTIAASASTGELSVEDSRNIDVFGQVAAIKSTTSGNITLTDARVFPGGVESFSSGSLTICGSEIGLNSETMADGSGGVNVKDSGAVHAVAEGTCGASQIEGSVIVEKGTGAVRIVGATLAAGDFVVIERSGNVALDGATVSDTKIEKSDGNITLSNVVTDSDTSIVENAGDVAIDASSLGGDVEIKLNRDVALTQSAFRLEDVQVSNNGNVVIDRSCDLSLTITENDTVAITNNNAAPGGAECFSGLGFTDADVSKNGNVIINNNTGESLSCSDNGSVGGSGNAISFLDGQCTGIGLNS